MFLQLLSVMVSTAIAADANSIISVGTGIYDVTGPAADINFMGYAMMGQVGRGIHTRLRSRAFVFDTTNAKPQPPYNTTRMFAFVSVDMGMGSSAVTDRVLELLDAEPTTTGKFTNDNM
jgi:neutral ceramidase